jgi:hypothetical protein
MALQRLRVGPRRGSTMLGVLAAALLLTALFVTGRWQNLAGGPPPSPTGPTAAQAPYRLGSGYRCPLGRPVLAMADGHSYPSGHPTKPPKDVGAIACYQTPEEAAAAGYRPRAAANRRTGDWRGVPGSDRPGVSCPLPAGRRPARLCRALPGAASNFGAWYGSAGAVWKAGFLPPWTRAFLSAGWVRGAAGLCWRRQTATRQPAARRIPDTAADRSRRFQL